MQKNSHEAHPSNNETMKRITSLASISFLSLLSTALNGRRSYRAVEKEGERRVHSEMVTRDAIRCCVSCILPCGTLDVIRIVHVSGRVEENRARLPQVTSCRRARSNVLRKPPPSAFLGGVEAPKVMTLPPNAELERGKIYFLVPVALPAPEKARSDATTTRRRRKKEERVM